MTVSERVFLVLCQELSFHKAAEKCFMSQQSLSEHIHRLEEQYRTELFRRRPKVALTDAGAALRRMLLREQAMELDLERELETYRSDTGGKVSLGIGITRARIYLPRILEEYRKNSPNTEVIVRMDDTAKLLAELRRGQLDCFIGTDPACEADENSISVRHESIYLIVPEALLPEGTEHGGKIRDLSPFTEIPFVRNSPGSILNGKVDTVLAAQQKRIRQIASVSDYDIQLDFCLKGAAAAFLPDSVLENFGYERLKENRLVLYEVEGLEHIMEICFVWDAKRSYPPCVRNMLDCMRELCRRGFGFA